MAKGGGGEAVQSEEEETAIQAAVDAGKGNVYKPAVSGESTGTFKASVVSL